MEFNFNPKIKDSSARSKVIIQATGRWVVMNFMHITSEQISKLKDTKELMIDTDYIGEEVSQVGFEYLHINIPDYREVHYVPPTSCPPILDKTSALVIMGNCNAVASLEIDGPFDPREFEIRWSRIRFGIIPVAMGRPFYKGENFEITEFVNGENTEVGFFLADVNGDIYVINPVLTGKNNPCFRLASDLPLQFDELNRLFAKR